MANNNNQQKRDRIDNDIIDNNIKNSVSSELEKKGWKEVATDPDVLLDYNVVVKKGVKRESDPVYGYPHTQYSKTNKLIWQGWAKGEINNRNITTKEATAEVKSIFKKFEYPG